MCFFFRSLLRSWSDSNLLFLPIASLFFWGEKGDKSPIRALSKHSQILRSSVSSQFSNICSLRFSRVCTEYFHPWVRRYFFWCFHHHVNRCTPRADFQILKSLPQTSRFNFQRQTSPDANMAVPRPRVLELVKVGVTRPGKRL